MSESFLSVWGECRTEKIIEKSRFITTSMHVDDGEQAEEFISRIRAEFKDATHNCYAYIADALGNLMRFSDDGEPQGTAGMPMLEIIKGARLKLTAVVVTRYFGGIKLGAGGLVRAYAGCVKENLAAAKIVSYFPSTHYSFTVSYPMSDRVVSYLLKVRDVCRWDDPKFSDKVTFTIVVKQEAEETFVAGLRRAVRARFELNNLGSFDFPYITK